MNKRERFMKFLNNEPVDRAPVAFFHHFTANDEWFKGLVSPEIYEKNIDGHRKAREVFDPDVIKVMNEKCTSDDLRRAFSDDYDVRCFNG